MNKVIHLKQIQIQVNDKTSDFGRIFIIQNTTTICRDGLQKVLVRTFNAVSEPVILLLKNITENSHSVAQFTFSDPTDLYTCIIDMQSTENGIRCDMSVKAPVPIWLAEWQLSGLNFDEMIIPALGGQSISNKMPDDTFVSFKYPFWWNAQFVIGQKGDQGLCVSSRDAGSDLKLLRIGRQNGHFELTYGFEASAREKATTLQATWFIEAFEGDWRVVVDRHREWLEGAFDLAPLTEKAFYPSWMQRINFILELWGARRDSIEPLHTFVQMEQRLEEWRHLHDPEQTLLYLPGFAEHGIDSNAPDYNPSPLLGGKKGFKSLVEKAHGMGYKVMIHTNILAMTFHHRFYPQFQQYQVIDAFDRPQSWGLDIDGDWLAEPFFAYMNPGYKAWGNLMSTVIGELVEKFNIDGVFLDQTLLAFNVSQGPDFQQGMREHICRLQKSFPHILFAGEGMHEQIMQPLSVAQIHGLDSIAQVHGLEEMNPWRTVHPVSTYLFNKYVRYTAHLLTKHPSHPLFASQEDAYQKLNVIPALCLYHNSQEMDLPQVRQMIARAKTLI